MSKIRTLSGICVGFIGVSALLIGGWRTIHHQPTPLPAFTYSGIVVIHGVDVPVRGSVTATDGRKALAEAMRQVRISVQISEKFERNLMSGLKPRTFQPWDLFQRSGPRPPLTDQRGI